MRPYTFPPRQAGRRTACGLLLLVLAFVQLALAAGVSAGSEGRHVEAAVVASAASASGPRYAAHASNGNGNGDGAIAYSAPGPSGALLERIGRFLSSLLPDPEQWEDIHHGTVGTADGINGGGGLFGDGGAALAWGASTLEVVKTQASYLTRPAAFGPRIHSDDGLRGILLPISDFYTDKASQAPQRATTQPSVENYGCPYKGGPGWRDEDFDDDNGDMLSPVDSPQVTGFSSIENVNGSAPKPPADWIALVERGGGCAFAAKVRVAQALGATAVVVGDAPNPEYEHGNFPDKSGDPGFSGRLVTMFAPGDTSDIKVPSTFITRPSYVDLIRLIDEETTDAAAECAERRRNGEACEDDDTGVTRQRGVDIILWRDDVMWEWPLIDLAFVLLLLPSFMTLVTIIVHRIRLVRQRRKERAPEIAVLNLPCLIWRPNGQPWEKVEDDQVLVVSSGDRSPANHGTAEAGNSSGIAGTTGSRQPEDMELGPAPLEEGSEAGPSTLRPATRPASSPSSTEASPPPVATQENDRTYYSCDECAICLSDFVDGEKVRVLPCGHVFHLPEIDSWLLRVKKLCPICKRDITVPIPPSVPAPALAALEPQQPQQQQQAGSDGVNGETGLPSSSSSSLQGNGTANDEDNGPTETSPLLRRQ